MATVILAITTVAMARVGCFLIEDPDLTLHEETTSGGCESSVDDGTETTTCTGTCTKLVWEEAVCKGDTTPNTTAYCERVDENVEATQTSGVCYYLVNETQAQCDCIPSANEVQVQVAGQGLNTGNDEAGCGHDQGT